MREKDLISVLMVNYNKGEWIRESIESVLEQTYRKIQFIIVDDGSTDQSPQIIEEFARKDRRIEYYLLPENQNFCVGSNYGLQKVKGNYLARIDSDDVWIREKLENQLEFMCMHEDCHISFTGVDLIDEEGNSLNEADHSLWDMFNKPEMTREENLRYFFTKGNYLAHPTVMMKTNLQREIGNYNLAYCQSQDFDYWVRVVKKYRLYKMPERYIRYRRFIKNPSQNLSSKSETATTRYLNEYMIIRSHFFEGLSDKLFADAFRCMFRNTQALTNEEYACEKAFLLCRNLDESDKIPSMLGLLELEKLFRDEKTTRVLKDIYDYEPKDYYKDMGQRLFENGVRG